ncbi:hypothetical protein [Saliphagus sp. LR7]|uniref:DUF7344 domain-containing protein n=1 Tax=Saliphagus sp. LR7 TaxID=2282654 RepID=UPI000DF84EBA|nr:hypothetical protein [Saliphagus sp. LR7]
MTLDHRTGSTELVLELVTDQYRRKALQHLIDADEQAVHLEELVEGVAETGVHPLTKQDSSPPVVESSPRDRLRLLLHHSHLPKLDEADVIEYDIRSETIRYHSTPHLEKLVAFINSELE